MGIKAAQQEMEGNESTRNYFSRPVSERGDPSQLLGTKQGQAAYKALNEGQVKQLEAEQKRINLIGAGAGAVLENPTMETFTSVVSNLVDRGIYTPQQRDQAFAAIGNDPSKIKAFVTPIFNQAISAEKRLSDITSRRNTDVSSGPAYGQLKLAQEEAARKQKEFELIRGIVSSGTSSATASPVNLGGDGVVSTPQGAPVAGGTVNALAPAAVNALVTPPAGQTSTAPVMSQKDQLINQISQLARIPSVEASRALDMKIKEHNVLYPDAKVEQDVNGYLINIVNGVSKPVVDRNGNPVKGKPIPETSFEKTVRAAVGEDVVKAVKRAEVAPRNIQKIDETLGILSSGGAITGFGADLRLNVERAMSLYGADIKAGRRVADTQILDALLGSDVFPTLQSMGLGSKNIDTPAEREYLRQVMTGTIKMDRDALLRLTRIRRQVEVDSIKDYNQKIESGKLNNYFKATDQTPEKIEIPNKIIRSGTHKDGRRVNEYADGTIEYAN
jgi:hypothetical protein